MRTQDKKHIIFKIKSSKKSNLNNNSEKEHEKKIAARQDPCPNNSLGCMYFS